MFPLIVLRYELALDGKKWCLPDPDSIYPFKHRLKYLERGRPPLVDPLRIGLALRNFLVDDMYIELTDSKLGQGAVGFVFKGYVFPKTQTRFKQKTFAAVKVGCRERVNEHVLTGPIQ